MIAVGLARELRAAGLQWSPGSGDRFVVDLPEMADEVFVLSDMTIEVRRFPNGSEIAFNGTTEWALDSVAPRQAVWLPAEDQLRTLLGDAFVRLERCATGHRVVVVTAGSERGFDDADPAAAYGLALLHLLRGGAG